MRNVERKLAEDFVCTIRENKNSFIVEDKYYNYKLWVNQMELSNLQSSNLLKNLVEKIYQDYKKHI